jgi:hypothetical protein
MNADRGADLAFVVGTGRCGSTVLHEVLCRHHDVAFVSNVDDRLWPLRGRGRANHRLLALAERVQRGTPRRMGLHVMKFAPSEGFRLLQHQVSPILADPHRPLTADDAMPWLVDRTRDYFSHLTAAHPQSLFLQRFTGWPRVELLHECFPAARFVYLIRDGRAVTASWLQTAWGPGYTSDHWQIDRLTPDQHEAWVAGGRSHVDLAALMWCQQVDAYDDAARVLPTDQWLTIHYEDLTTEPTATLRRVTDFLALDWTPAFEQSIADRQFTPERVGAYRAQLGEAKSKHLTELLHDHLAARGYA